MPCTPGEYHPYAACLMFRACGDSTVVRANLDAVRAQPTPPAVVEPLTDEQVGEICGQFTKLVREKRSRHIERGIDAGADYYIGDVAYYVGHAVNNAAHGIKGDSHGAS